MIRLSDKSDINGIIKLWKEAFGDSEREIMFFLDNRYKPENTLVAEENGKIASMLFLLEGEMKIDKKLYPSYYLYAACTLKEFRGRGYMASLLAFAKDTALKRNVDFICLLPAEESLYKFYENHGYKPVFKKNIYTLSRNSIDDSSFSDKESSCNPEKIRNNAFVNIDYFKWDSLSLDFAIKHNKFYGGQVVMNCEGYSLYSISNDEIYVKEITFTDNIDAVLSNLFAIHSDVNKIIVDLPVGIKTSAENYEIVNWGMALAINNNAEKILDGLKDAYLGLTLI